MTAHSKLSPENLDTVAHAVTTVRVDKDLTQEQAARKAGVSVRTLRKVEQGEKVSGRVLKKIGLQILGIDLSKQSLVIITLDGDIEDKTKQEAAIAASLRAAGHEFSSLMIFQGSIRVYLVAKKEDANKLVEDLNAKGTAVAGYQVVKVTAISGRNRWTGWIMFSLLVLAAILAGSFFLNSDDDVVDTPWLVHRFTFDDEVKGFKGQSLIREDSARDVDGYAWRFEETYIKRKLIPWYAITGRVDDNAKNVAKGSIELIVKIDEVRLKKGQRQSLVLLHWNDTSKPTQYGSIGELAILPNEDGKGHRVSWSCWNFDQHHHQALKGDKLQSKIVSRNTIPLTKWVHLSVVWGPDGTFIGIDGKEAAKTDVNLYPALYDPKQSKETYVYLNPWGSVRLRGLLDNVEVWSIQRPIGDNRSLNPE